MRAATFGAGRTIGIILGLLLVFLLCVACSTTVNPGFTLFPRATATPLVVYSPNQPLIQATVDPNIQLLPPAQQPPQAQQPQQQPPQQQQPVVPNTGSTDPLYPALRSLGFNTRAELTSYFTAGVNDNEISACPSEANCVRILHEKDDSGYVSPFNFCNNTNVTFDGWRAAGQTGGQAGVPPGCWMVEGVTIRPWR